MEPTRYFNEPDLPHDPRHAGFAPPNELGDGNHLLVIAEATYLTYVAPHQIVAVAIGKQSARIYLMGGHDFACEPEEAKQFLHNWMLYRNG